MVTLTTHKDVRTYPCRSMESAIKLAERFIAGVIKPRPAAPQPEATPAPAAEPGGGVSQLSPVAPPGIFFCSLPQKLWGRRLLIGEDEFCSVEAEGCGLGDQRVLKLDFNLRLSCQNP